MTIISPCMRLSSSFEKMSSNSKYGTVPAETLDIFYSPARLIVAGMSNSGKSQLCLELIAQYHHRFAQIVICGVTSHPLEEHPEIKSKLVLNSDLVDPLDYHTSNEEAMLFVMDDLYTKALNNEKVCDLFTRGRHKNISTILICQNVFGQGKWSRDVSLNASHFILTRIRDLSSVETLGRQFFGKSESREFMEVYKSCMRSHAYPHLLIDLSPSTPPSVQLRTNIIRQQHEHEIAYQWGRGE